MTTPAHPPYTDFRVTLGLARAQVRSGNDGERVRVWLVFQLSEGSSISRSLATGKLEWVRQPTVLEPGSNDSTQCI